MKIYAPNDQPLDSLYRKDPTIVARQIAGEYILVPIRQSAGEVESIFTLNEVGARIWELLDGQRSLLQVRDQMVVEFEVTLDEAEADLFEFIHDLDTVGVVQQV